MIRIKRKSFLVLTAVLLAAAHSIGQANLKDYSLNIIPPDPEAASLGTYGNYNLNLSSGQVDISVPLVKLKGISLDYPVGLSYDHSGIRIDEHATCAGTNWNFNGVGMISRTVVGLPDEWSGSGYNDMYTYITTLSTGYPAAFYLTSGYYPFNQLFSPLAPPKDLEPDIYSFNFLGHNGKFFRDPATGQFYTMPYSMLKIQTSTGNINGNFFDITDDKGYIYQFHEVRRISVDDECSGSSSAYDYAGQWYLTKIINPSGSTEFNFEYALSNVTTIQHENRAQNYLISETVYPGGCMADPSCTVNQGNYTVYPLMNTNYCINSVSYNGRLLTKITSPNEQLIISYGTRTDENYRISNIEHLSADNTSSVEKWYFYHGYYQHNATNNKLRLDSIALYNSMTRISAYTFDYNGNDVPPVLSKSQDYWGYNNGVANANMIPKVWWENQYLGSADRNPYETSAEKGILTKITYPTGGYDAFEYELNNYGRIGKSGSGTDLVNKPIWVDVAPINLTTHSYQASSANDPIAHSVTFTINDATVVHFTSHRRFCDIVPCSYNLCDPPCSSGSCNHCNPDNTCFVKNTLSCSNCTPAFTTQTLNSSPGGNQSWDLALNPGTYTFKTEIPSWNSGAEYNWESADISYKVISGYNKNVDCGGLRVKKITSFDQYSNTSAVRKFNYTDASDNTRSSGIITAEPTFVSHVTSAYSCYSPNCNVNTFKEPNVFDHMLTISQGNYERNYSDGQPVLYSRVLETIGDNGEGGIIEHKFSFYNDKTYHVFPYPGASPRSWRRGLPVETNYFTSNNTLVSSDVNQYTFEPTTNFHIIKGLKVGYLQTTSPVENDLTQVTTAPMDYTSEWMYLSQNTKTQYPLNGGTPITVQTNYYYDNPAHLQATRLKTTKSDGSIVTDYTKYPADYTISNPADPAAGAIYSMLQKNMHNYPVEEYLTNTANGSERITGAELNTYKQFSSGTNNAGQIALWQQYKLKLDAPRTYNASSPLSTVTSSGSFSIDNSYEKQLELGSYNINDKPLDATKIGNEHLAFIWMYNGLYPVAQASGAAQNQVAYTSFEATETGNWNYNAAAVSSSGGITGNKYYSLSSSALLAGPAVPFGNYVVSYWSKNGAPQVNGSGSTFTGATINGWTYHEHTLTNATTAVFSGSAQVDEVRLYPVGAQMKTLTYNPIVGVTSESDAAGHIRYYEYDGLGRLTLVRDQDGNIIKKVDYGIQQGE
ncbi:RHS repeat domain-containing protein [Chitinophagaceae bacterium MMS25-I14]